MYENNYLIVIDMQNDFIDGALGSKEAQQIVPNVIRKIKNFNGKIIYTRDTHYDNYLDTEEGKNIPIIHCIKDTKGWQIYDEIDKLRIQNNSKVFNKNYFYCEELANFFSEKCKQQTIDNIELVGLCTDICVNSNALLIKKAVDSNIKITIDASCCAGSTPQAHISALNQLKQSNILIKA